MPLVITSIRLSSEPLPNNGTPHLENQLNPITLAAEDQPKPLEVILSLAASRTRFAIVPLPSVSVEGDCEIDGADSVSQGVEEVPLEEPTGIEEVQEEPVMEERAGSDY